MTLPVYLEIGSKRTFAAALDWPGWSRSGKDEASALDALLAYARRYAAVLRLAHVPFQQARDIQDFKIVDRLPGDATTDFGAPSRIPPADRKLVDEAELRRLQSILKGCWRTFDQASAAARGRTLRTGPRGGGRDLQKMTGHVLGAEQAYLSKLGVKAPLAPGAPIEQQLTECRDAILKGMASAARGELPAHGPRGSVHWPLRYFVRRTGWHVLDHAWELEDRTLFD